MPHHKTKEIYIEDVADLQQLMYLQLIDDGVINLSHLSEEQCMKLLTPTQRLRFIREFVDAYVYTGGIWRALPYIHTYDKYMEPVYMDYVRTELPWLEEISPELSKVFSNIEDAIISILPKCLSLKTWNVWSITMVTQSLVMRNEGDWRVISFAEEVLANTDHPLHGKIPAEVLYQHE